MRTAIAVAAIALATLITPAAIAQTSSTNSQQERMKSCNTQAGTQKLTGDARKTFMSNCLSGKTTTASKNSQQEKMKTCNTQASSQKLTGDARKSFMSNCLKGS
jgi:hypothetical protein